MATTAWTTRWSTTNGDVVAVLDWEICTLGDPLADLGLLHVYWNGPNDVAGAWSGTATTTPGFWDRPQLAQRYAEVSGRDISHLDFYIAFAFWKLACIIEGVYSRYLGGALGDRPPEELAPFKLQVEQAAAERREVPGRTAMSGAPARASTVSTNGSATNRCCTSPCSS